MKFNNTCKILLLILIIILIIIKCKKNIKKNYESNNYSNNYSNELENKMKKYNVIFAGCCRSVEPFIKKNLQNIEECSKKFNNYSVIIYENDSSDKTRQILNENKRDNYHYIFEDNIKEPKRTKRLARARNLILDKVNEINKDKYYQYLILLDMDEANYQGTFVKTIHNCFLTDDWAVMTANQNGNYYDIWALRTKELNYDCIQECNFSRKPCSAYYKKYNSNELIDVDSAFGGTAVYKLSTIPYICKYNGQHENGKEKCEHVDFNKCIKNQGGKIYINTNFLNDGKFNFFQLFIFTINNFFTK